MIIFYDGECGFCNNWVKYYLNNTVENCQELCDICHKEKGKRNGDFKEQYKYKYKLKKVA